MIVRLLPMSMLNQDMAGKTIEQIQKEFFINYLKNNKGEYKYKNKTIAEPGALVLFQIQSLVIASAYLKEIKEFRTPDVDGHKGVYIFNSDTIKIFKPIDVNELRKYSLNFNNFNQSAQRIEISNISGLNERINKYEVEKKYENELLKRLNISEDDIYNYKVRLLIQNDVDKEKNSVKELIGWKDDQDILNRSKVIVFIKNYGIDKDCWLYAGTFDVSKKTEFEQLNNCIGYDLTPIGNIKDVGNLNIKYKNDAQQLISNLETVVDNMSIANLAESNLTYNEIRVSSKRDWIKALDNEESLGENKIIDIIKFIYMSKDHISTCGTISEYLSISIAEINFIISSFGRRVLELLSLPEVKGDNGQNRRWNIPFKTNFEKNKSGLFTWELRSELVEAIEEKYPWKDMYIIQNCGKKLERYERYSRKDIHDIFSPNTNFTPGAGLWGISGIIQVPNTVSDYIFIVTYGRSQSGHEFDEGIDENGILRWQSQPGQTLDDRKIQNFINHDYNSSNIYLFLREKKTIDYSYLGKLAYVSHDNERERPVYFKWQILDWDPNKGKISLDENVESNVEIINKINEKEEKIDLDNIDSKEFTVNLIDTTGTYKKTDRKGKATKEFNNKIRNFEGEAKKNTKLGNKGEDIVVDYEKKHLNSIGRYDLAEQVIATRNYAGNAERFDVLSFEDDGSKKYIEVKTTTGGINNVFYISENEVEFSEAFKDNYYLYRLYNFNQKNKETDMRIIKGSLNRKVLTPTNYVCRIGEFNENI